MNIADLSKDIVSSVKGYIEGQFSLMKTAMLFEIQNKVKEHFDTLEKSVTVSIEEDQLEQIAKMVVIPEPIKGDKGDTGDAGETVSADEVAKSMEGHFAKWALDFERKADLVLEKAIGRMPKPKDGKDGRDALEIEDFDLSISDDGRTITVGLKRGETVIEKSVKLNIPQFKGYWNEGEYSNGDVVVRSGCSWAAMKDTTEIPSTESQDWIMMAKRGGTGKSAYDISRDAGFEGTKAEWLESLGKKQTVKL